MSRRRIGRVRVDFAVIERLAEQEFPASIAAALGGDWVLSRGSALHRRKDGSFTLCLIWKQVDGNQTYMSTLRGLRLGST